MVGPARVPQQKKAALRRRHQAFAGPQTEFDFGQDQTDATGPSPRVDSTGQTVGTCPSAAPRVRNADAHVCEKSVAPFAPVDFRTGKNHSATNHRRAQVQKAARNRAKPT